MRINYRLLRSYFLPCALALLAASYGGPVFAASVKAKNLPEALQGSQSLNGAVFLDVNSNGWRDQGEPAIPELPILLDGIVWALTDSCGQFAFSGLSEGLHTIVIEPAEMPVVYSGAAKVTQTVFAGKATRNSRFEVGLFPPKPRPVVIVKAEKKKKVLTAVEKVAPSASVLAEAEKQKALAAIAVVNHQLDRVKSSGYAVLVRDTVTRIEAALAEASSLSDAGDYAGALRLAGLSATAMDEARKRIETETQQPLRW